MRVLRNAHERFHGRRLVCHLPHQRHQCCRRARTATGTARLRVAVDVSRSGQANVVTQACPMCVVMTSWQDYADARIDVTE